MNRQNGSIFFFVLLLTHSHANAAYTYVGAQALPYPGAFPEDAHGAILFPVEDAGEHVVHVGARADQEEDDEEEGLEVEEGGLRSGAVVISIGVVSLNGARGTGRTMFARWWSRPGLVDVGSFSARSLFIGAMRVGNVWDARRGLLFWTQCWMPGSREGRWCW